MSRFYTDGYDPLIVYEYTHRKGTNDPVTEYVTDSNKLDNALLDIIKGSANNRAQFSTEHLSFEWTVEQNSKTVTVYSHADDEMKIVAEFTMKKIRIPNCVFERLEATVKAPGIGMDKITTPFINTPYITTDRTTGYDAIRNDPYVSSSYNASAVQHKGLEISNRSGESVGTMNITPGAVPNPTKSADFVETFIVQNAFGNLSRVPVAKKKEFYSSLKSAKADCGDAIESFIVPDHNNLSKRDIELLFSDEPEDTESVYVFSLKDFNTHIINRNGSSIRAL